jgi:hypothetical protein
MTTAHHKVSPIEPIGFVVAMLDGKNARGTDSHDRHRRQHHVMKVSMSQALLAWRKPIAATAVGRTIEAAG